MEEAAGADDVVIVNHGVVAAHGTPAMLRERYCSDRMSVVPRNMSEVASLLESEGIRYETHADVIEIPLSSTLDAIPIMRRLDGLVESLEVRSGSLDDAFIRITGEGME